MTDHSQVIQYLRQNPGQTPEAIVSGTGVTPKGVRRVLSTLASSGLAFDDGLKWWVSANADPEKPLVRTIFVAERKKRQRARKAKSKTADVRAMLHDQYMECVRKVALRLPTFTADNVREEFDVTFGTLHSMDARLSGPVMLHAQKEGWCKRSGMTLVSERRSGGLTQVYVSLLCEDSIDPLDTMGVDELRAEVRRLRDLLGTRAQASPGRTPDPKDSADPGVHE